jgi:hypothetical protein
MDARGGSFVQQHLPTRLPGLIARAGLELAHADAIPVLELTGGPGTFGGGIIGSVADVAARHGVPRDETEAWRADLLARANGGEYFFGLTRYLFIATRPG